MTRKVLLEIERKPETLERIGLSRTTLHNMIKDGLWTPPVSLGSRAIGFLRHETDELLVAYINNHTDEEKRELVRKLVAERKQLLEVMK